MRIRRLVVVHGASGDLFFRKLLPALYTLYCQYGDKVLFDYFGTGSKFKSTEEFQSRIRDTLLGMKLESRLGVSTFVNSFRWIEGRCSEEEGALRIRDAIFNYREQCPDARELHYFSLWPGAFEDTLKNYLKFEIVTPEKVSNWDPQKVQIVLEKPLAETVEQADTLMHCMNDLAGKDAVNEVFVAYDHYLFKNGVWGILVWRFANHISEPTHNWEKISSIIVRANERVTVGDRGGYVGAVMDMISNHLFTVYGLLRVGHPLKKGERFYLNGSWQESSSDECLDANWLHPRMLNIAKELQNPDVFVRLDLARYHKGTVKVLSPNSMEHFQDLPGFVEAGGSPQVETAARLVLKPGVPLLDNRSDRWGQTTHFVLESAKGTPCKETSYDINYRKVPEQFFKGSPFDMSFLEPNMRSIIIEKEKRTEFAPGKFRDEKFWGDSRLTMVPGPHFPQMEPRRVESLVPLPDVGDGYPQALTELLVPKRLQSGEVQEVSQMVRSLCLLPAEVQLNVIKAVVPRLEEARADSESWTEYAVGTLPVWPDFSEPKTRQKQAGNRLVTV